MEANPSKFQLLFMKSKNEVTVQIDGNRVDSKDCVTLLGVILDKKLSFNEQIGQLCRKAAPHLAVLPHFGYCNLVWHFCGVNNTTKLQ